MDDEVLVLTVEEAAEVLRVSPSFAYQLMKRGELPCLKLGKRMLVPRKALLRFIEECPVPISPGL